MEIEKILNSELMDTIEKYSLLESSATIKEDGIMEIYNPKNLRQVQEILKDANFFKNALFALETYGVQKWLFHADKSVFDDNELILAVAKYCPTLLRIIPTDKMNDSELIKNIASIVGVNYYTIIRFIPSDLMTMFTSIYEEKNQVSIDKDYLRGVIERRISSEDYIYIVDKVKILENSKIEITNGTMYSRNSEEELKQVQEILKDAKFFKSLFRELSRGEVSNLNAVTVGHWLRNADRSVFDDSELFKIIALTNSFYFHYIPEEYMNNRELILEVASLSNLNYKTIIGYIPLNLIDEFTSVYEKKHQVKIEESFLEETKNSKRNHQCYRYVKERLDILRKTKMSITDNGIEIESEGEELRQVQEILKDVDFFKNGLRILPNRDMYEDVYFAFPSLLFYADKTIFNDKELVILLASSLPSSLGVVPNEVIDNEELILEIAKTPGMKYLPIMDYIPSWYMDEFTQVWSETNGKKISPELLEELKGYGILFEGRLGIKHRQK